jgi:hypothetical protein
MNNLIGNAELVAQLDAELDALLARNGDTELPALELLQAQGLATLWNARERAFSGAGARLLPED